ncbi:MAG TPA: M48 family metallopeptidase [Opitutaceae bacterium]|nr:M48 family metallopeptidase [Opitutaceae bacterium]HPN99957.1 M48 family metallopeptidase [Opitutaceae bacterium]
MDFFEAQASAKRRTSRLMLLFILAVIGVIAACYLAALIVVARVRPTSGTWLVWDGSLFGGVSLVVCLITGGAMLFKWLQLRAGGSVIAEMVGGRRVDPQSTDLAEQRLLNIVEEMSIASGVPMPAVYLLDDEGGLNAFAAGLTTSDAVVAVTRGSLEKLSRDELQGVVAHEFSHILNGDMRLNVRLTAVLFGILVIGLMGRGLLEVMLRSGAVRTRGKGKSGGPGVFIIVGIAMLVIGYVGYFFGRLIQAAISRQREYLADAAAVQFTRNPLGVSGALKKIGGYSLGSRLDSAAAAQIGHFFFAQSFRAGFTQLWATHPPLEERIRTIDPSWDGRFFEPETVVDVARESHQALQPPVLRKPAGARLAAERAFSMMPALQAAAPRATIPFVPAQALAQAGALTESHFTAAQSLLSQIPQPLRTAARQPDQAPALIYALLLDADDATRNRQLTLVQQHDPGASATLVQLQPDCAALPRAARLPLLQLSLPALRFADAATRDRFLRTLEAVIHADGRVSPFEFALHKTLSGHLRLSQAPTAATQLYSFNAVAADIAAILSALAWINGASDQAAASRAFAYGAAHLKMIETPLALLPDGIAALELLDHALDRLAAASLPIKKRTLIAAAHVIGHDGTITPEEDELFRAISAALDVPLPAAA